ncbi:hypothetical protein D3C72_930990 [compost metagenome]
MQIERLHVPCAGALLGGNAAASRFSIRRHGACAAGTSAQARAIASACSVASLGGLLHGQQLILADQRLHRVGAFVVPVTVKAAGQILDHRPQDQHVRIQEVGAVVIVEIGVAEVAPAHHPHHVVGQKQLVVHTLLGALKIGCGIPHAAERGVAAAHQRIEHAHLDIRLERQAHHLGIAPGAMKIVEQHPHPNAPACRLDHGIEEAGRAGIGMDGVVLQIQRLLRALHQCQACAIGGLGAGQNLKTRGFGSCLVFSLLALVSERPQDGVGRGRHGM